MPEIKLRFNLDSEEVELVVDDEVALSSGKDVFESWVQAYNDKHPVAPVEEEKKPEPVVDKEPETPVDSTESETGKEDDNAKETS